MNTERISPAFHKGARLFGLLCLCCLLLSLAACAGKMGGKKSGAAAPVDPNAKQMAYGTSLTLPANWGVAAVLGPEAASKESLDQRRQTGERILLMQANTAPTASNIESLVAVFLVNAQGLFMPREFAEKMRPEEFRSLAQTLVEQDNATLKKQKSKVKIMDVQISSEKVDGNFAVVVNETVSNAQGNPVRSKRWEIYLPNGAGIAVITGWDPGQPNAENEINNIVRSLRIQ